jgi:hypothetical protein
MEFSRCVRYREAGPCWRTASTAGLSKLNSVRIPYVEVDVLLGELSDRTAEAIDG